MASLGRKPGAAALTSADIPDNSITAAKIVEGTITVGDIGTNAVGADELADDAVDTAAIADGAVDTARLAADAVDGTKIADNAIDSEHYAAGSIDNEHLADDAVGSDELANDVVIDTSGAITGGAITGIGTNRFSKDDSTPSGTAVSIFSDAVFGSTDTVNTGITVLGTGQTGLVFGNATDSDVGQIRYQHSTNKIEIIAGALISLTAASDDVTVNTGNLVIGAASSGVMFHPHDVTVTGPPGSDSNLLDDYEEGTWTPTCNVGTLTFADAHYTKIGRLVHATARIESLSDTTSSTTITFSGLPFGANNGNRNLGHAWGNFTEKVVYFYASGASFLMYFGGTGTDYGRSIYSAFSSGANFIINLVYDSS